MVDCSRRGFLAGFTGAVAVTVAGPAYEDLGLVVHRPLPHHRRFMAGDLLYDASCGRTFRIVRTIETREGIMAKTRWVRRLA